MFHFVSFGTYFLIGTGILGAGTCWVAVSYNQEKIEETVNLQHDHSANINKSNSSIPEEFKTQLEAQTKQQENLSEKERIFEEINVSAIKLTKKLDILKEEVEKITEDSKNVIKDYDKAVDFLNTLTTNTELKEKVVNDEKSIVDSLENEIKDLKTTLLASYASVNDLQLSLNLALADLENAGIALSNNEILVEQEKAIISQTTVLIANLCLSAGKKQQRLTAIKENITTQKATKAAKLDDIKAKVQSRKQTLTSEINSLESEIQQLQKEIDEAKSKSAGFVSQLNQLEGAENIPNKDTIDAQKSKIQSQKTTQDNLASNKTNNKNSKTSQKQQKEQEKNKLNLANFDVDFSNLANDTTDQALKSDIISAASAITQLDIDIAQAEDNEKKLGSEKSNLDRKVEFAKTALEASKLKKQNYESNTANLTKTQQEKQKIYDEKEKELVAAKKKQADVQKNTTSKESELVVKKSKLSQYVEEHKQLTISVSAAEISKKQTEAKKNEINELLKTKEQFKAAEEIKIQQNQQAIKSAERDLNIAKNQ